MKNIIEFLLDEIKWMIQKCHMINVEASALSVSTNITALKMEKNAFVGINYITSKKSKLNNATKNVVETKINIVVAETE